MRVPGKVLEGGILLGLAELFRPAWLLLGVCVQARARKPLRMQFHLHNGSKTEAERKHNGSGTFTVPDCTEIKIS